MKRYSNKDAIIDNLRYRIGIYHPGINVQIGTGNTNASVMVVQPHAKMPERDAITGALKNFDMLGDAYRATSVMVDYGAPKNIEYPDLIRHEKKTQQDMNRYYLKELIEIIRPLVVIACGPEVMSLLRQRKVQSRASHIGKKFQVSDLTTCVFYAVTNPADYGYARAPQDLKQQGRQEWDILHNLYIKLKKKQEKERWAC